jgi:hypothetical protein
MMEPLTIYDLIYANKNRNMVHLAHDLGNPRAQSQHLLGSGQDLLATLQHCG